MLSLHLGHLNLSPQSGDADCFSPQDEAGDGVNKCSVDILPDGSRFMQSLGERVGLKTLSKKLTEVSTGFTFT